MNRSPLTSEQRAAASECIQLIVILVQSGTPQSKELATLIACRLVNLLYGTAQAALYDDETIEMWGGLAAALAAYAENETIQ